MKNNKLYYFAHPYTGDIEKNMELCTKRVNELLDYGWNIFSPLNHSHPLDVEKQRDPMKWYELDILFLKRCDGIILAPEWRESKGCMMEYGIARALGLEMYVYNKHLPGKTQAVV